MKIYLAGPMTGIKDHNYPAFHAAAARIRARGHECINPAELNPLGTDSLAWWLACMHRDIPHVLASEALALLPRWLDSDGTRLEIFNAVKLHKPIIQESTWSLLPPYICLRSILVREMVAFPPERIQPHSSKILEPSCTLEPSSLRG